MLERPELPDELIAAGMQGEYGLKSATLTFLPWGVDVHTAVFRVDTPGGSAYFLKLRKGDFDPISVTIPHFLKELGIHTIISPLETQAGLLFGKLGDYTMILYPFLPGSDGYQTHLTDAHWIALGRTLKRVHDAQVPAELTRFIPCESFAPTWRENVKQFQTQVEGATFDDPVAEKLSAFMRAKRPAISRMVSRAEELAHSLSQGTPEFVLCHSDAHPGNFLITGIDQLYLVDWDNPIFAPKERDLMFFGGGMAGDLPGGCEQGLFYQGYGPVAINRQALVYYRYERIIQDIAEFCKQLLLTSEGGEDREQAYIYLTSSFSPGNVVQAAVQTDQLLMN